MRLARFVLIFLFAGLPATLLAALQDGDLPAVRWYLHVDLAAMRSGEAGKRLYGWLDDEVFAELRDEIGFDVSKEADMITALATPDGGVTIVMDGNFSQTSKDRALALAAMSSEFKSHEYGGKAYFFVGDDDGPGAHSHNHDSLDGGAYLSLALKNKLLVTATQEQMHKLIDGKGRIPGDYAKGKSLLVLSAERNLVQAGISADGLNGDLGWNSNMLRNAKQVALVVADVAGKIAIEAKLVAAEEQMASSLASIVRGLISLQAFNDDIDPNLAAVLQSTTVDVSGATLTLKVALDPDAIVAALD